MNVYVDEEAKAWVPVSEATPDEARPFAAEALGWDGNDGDVVYLGIETIPTHEHEDGDDCVPACGTATACHAFEWPFP